MKAFLRRYNSVPDPDLQIRWGGGGLKNTFSVLRASVWSKGGGGRGGTCYPVPSPGSATII